MKSLSGVGLGLSLVFGCLLLALIGELYYLLWWKKKIISKRSFHDENGSQIPSQRSDFFYIFFCCWKKKPTNSLRSSAHELCSSVTLVHEPQSSNPNKELSLKPFGDQENMGPPRFLFTITEETREDLESEDGIMRNRKQSTSRSNLSDLLQILETPFLTPLGSPLYFTPPLTPTLCTDYQHRFDPSFESENDAAFNKLRSSPPPKFKFLRDAEEKMIQTRKIMEQTQNGVLKSDEESGSFITIIVTKCQEEEEDSNNSEQEYFSSSSSHPTIKSIPMNTSEIELNGC